jgi:hypothetical protein
MPPVIKILCPFKRYLLCPLPSLTGVRLEGAETLRTCQPFLETARLNKEAVSQFPWDWDTLLCPGSGVFFPHPE